MTSQSTHRARALRRVLPMLLVLLAGPRTSGAQGVNVGITPASLNVNIDSEFELSVTVTQAGSLFNGFDATVSFDPAALTFMALSPTSLQQGCLMTGVCSAVCGSTFHRFSSAADTLVITDILLCDQTALAGPGQVYKLRFKASTTPQVTHVRIRRALFYNAGLYVNPVTTADAEITIGTGVGVGEISPPDAGIRLHAEPNPGRGPMVFALEVDEAGDQHLEIHDITGRLVRAVDRGWRAQGARRVTWDGLDESGVRAPSGIYLVTLGAGDRVARIRVALLR